MITLTCTPSDDPARMRHPSFRWGFYIFEISSLFCFDRKDCFIKADHVLNGIYSLHLLLIVAFHLQTYTNTSYCYQTRLLLRQFANTTAIQWKFAIASCPLFAFPVCSATPEIHLIRTHIFPSHNTSRNSCPPSCLSSFSKQLQLACITAFPSGFFW